MNRIKVVAVRPVSDPHAVTRLLPERPEYTHGDFLSFSAIIQLNTQSFPVVVGRVCGGGWGGGRECFSGESFRVNRDACLAFPEFIWSASARTSQRVE